METLDQNWQIVSKIELTKIKVKNCERAQIQSSRTHTNLLI
jgi:hypothetical protein